MPKLAVVPRSMWPFALYIALVVLTIARGDLSNSNVPSVAPVYQDATRPRRSRSNVPQHDCETTFQRRQARATQRGWPSSAWPRTRALRKTRFIRGGREHKFTETPQGDVAPARGAVSRSSERQEDSSGTLAFTSSSSEGYGTDGSGSSSGNSGSDSENPAMDKVEEIAADLRAKRDDIAADVRARGEAFAADLKAKQERIADEVLRDRAPGAFGELAGHHSHDSANDCKNLIDECPVRREQFHLCINDCIDQYVDVAGRRSFFLGVRRLVLLVQVVEFVVALSWQLTFPYGGVASFVAAGDEKLGEGRGPILDARGRLGLAVAVSLGQAAMYTALLVFFGCDRVVMRAVRVTGWEHGAAVAWVLYRTFNGVAKLTDLTVGAWLAGMAFLCAYFGRQL